MPEHRATVWRGAALALLGLSAVTCGREQADVSADQRAPVRRAAPPPPVIRAPIAIDTGGTDVVELWPLSVSPARQLDDTRRIVEHLQADLSPAPGFERAALLASGDGSSLALLVVWADSAAAARMSGALEEWLRAEADTARRRRQFGTASVRVRVRHRAGTPPALTDAAMLQLTRYMVKPGHSFGALATLADSNLSKRVLQDTSALGGATLAAADSGALYTVLQARTATVLDPVLQSDGPLPFWAPFATRKEELMAVVAVVYRR